MKKTICLFAICSAILFALPSCKEKDNPHHGNNTETDDPGTNPGSGMTVNMPDCFVFYKDAKFIYKRTLNTGTSSKITWDVTAYNASTKTATISVKNGDSDPTTMQIRSGSKGIEFSSGGSWKALTDGGSEVNFIFGMHLNSIPSGCYGSIKNTTKIGTITIPGGRSSQGFQTGSSYSSTTGYHDSFMFDYSSGESWSTECGLTHAGYEYRNGNETPIFVNTYTVDLVAYDIPMPNGTRRTYMPSGSTVYDVTDTYITYNQHPANTQRYASMFFYFNDKKNSRSDILRYNPYVLWYENSWQYGQITNAYNTRWELSGWFAGKAFSASPSGGPRSGESFDCAGLYSYNNGSQAYTPFQDNGVPVYGSYVFFVMAETNIAVGQPDIDNTEFCYLQIPDASNYAASAYSIRVKLLDDGTIDTYTKAGTPLRIHPTVPDPSMVIGPVRQL